MWKAVLTFLFISGAAQAAELATSKSSYLDESYLNQSLSRVQIRASAPISVQRSLPVSKRLPNVISIEALGRGGFYSINYDHSLGSTVSLGAGFSYLGVGAGPGGMSLTMVPIYTNLYFNSSNHRFFFTGGVSMVFVGVGASSQSSTQPKASSSQEAFGISTTGGLPVVGLGYEYRGDGGFLFRLTPYMSVFPWIGTSFGAAF
ncbi:hypothetical protein K2X30_11280 [bacterium]|jgi:hypothetical protein|nr:hypothetical protein [bacterium]